MLQWEEQTTSPLRVHHRTEVTNLPDLDVRVRRGWEGAASAVSSLSHCNLSICANIVSIHVNEHRFFVLSHRTSDALAFYHQTPKEAAEIHLTPSPWRPPKQSLGQSLININSNQNCHCHRGHTGNSKIVRSFQQSSTTLFDAGASDFAHLQTPVASTAVKSRPN